MADIVKIDVLAMTWDEVLFTVEKCRPHPVRLLAEKVETQEVYERCIAAGFELFQGYYLAGPRPCRSRRSPPASNWPCT